MENAGVFCGSEENVLMTGAAFDVICGNSIDNHLHKKNNIGNNTASTATFDAICDVCVFYLSHSTIDFHLLK